MTVLTESKIETLAIELLQQQGYEYLSGSDIAPDSQKPMWSSSVSRSYRR